MNDYEDKIKNNNTKIKLFEPYNNYINDRTTNKENFSSKSQSVVMPMNNIISNMNTKKNINGCLPKRHKVFIRRVDGKKDSIEAVYNVSKGYFPDNYIPAGYNSRKDFNNDIMKKYKKMNLNNINGNSNRILKNNKNMKINYMNINDTKNFQKNLYIPDNSNSYMNIPLCVREVNSNLNPEINNYLLNFPQVPQAEYYKNYHLIKNGNKKIINYKNMLQAINAIFNFIYKTIKMIYEKIKKEFDMNEYRVEQIRISSLPNMDVACDVCEKPEDTLIKNKDKDDFLGYFEGIDNKSNFITKIWNITNGWLDRNEEIPLVNKVTKKPDCNVYYQQETFPKDKDGKIELPKF